MVQPAGCSFLSLIPEFAPEPITLASDISDSAS
jgi:hypothetical protein